MYFEQNINHIITIAYQKSMLVRDIPKTVLLVKICSWDFVREMYIFGVLMNIFFYWDCFELCKGYKTYSNMKEKREKKIMVCEHQNGRAQLHYCLKKVFAYIKWPQKTLPLLKAGFQLYLLDITITHLVLPLIVHLTTSLHLNFYQTFC